MYAPGHLVRAIYSEDSIEYEAEVLSVFKDPNGQTMVLVKFHGYLNVEAVPAEKVRATGGHASRERQARQADASWQSGDHCRAFFVEPDQFLEACVLRTMAVEGDVRRWCEVRAFGYENVTEVLPVEVLEVSLGDDRRREQLVQPFKPFTTVERESALEYLAVEKAKRATGSACDLRTEDAETTLGGGRSRGDLQPVAEEPERERRHQAAQERLEKDQAGVRQRMEEVEAEAQAGHRRLREEHQRQYRQRKLGLAVESDGDDYDEDDVTKARNRIPAPPGRPVWWDKAGRKRRRYK